MDEYMDAECFNMAIQILVCHDIQFAHEYMDCEFYVKTCVWIVCFTRAHIVGHVWLIKNTQKEI
jgi:hypothetical protein